MKKVMTAAVAMALAAGAVSAQAYEAGDWIIRAGATTVAPDTDSDDIVLPDGAGGTLTLEADVDDGTALGIIPAYMVTEKWAVELLLATPFEHDIEAQGQGSISGTNIDAATIEHLPPTLSVQYYPRGGSDGWQPYFGVGVNYTTFFSEDADNELIDTLGTLIPGVTDADVDLDDSFGLAAQAGIDIPFAENWALNLAVWYIDIDTTAEITAKADGVNVAKVDFDVEIDPWVYNVGVAYRF